jgi:hypothetical protein
LDTAKAAALDGLPGRQEGSRSHATAAGRELKDALCLVFLEFQFAAKSDDEKMINALRKSWEKMTEAARAEALKLDYGEREKNLISRALGS